MIAKIIDENLLQSTQMLCTELTLSSRSGLPLKTRDQKSELLHICDANGCHHPKSQGWLTMAIVRQG